MSSLSGNEDDEEDRSSSKSDHEDEGEGKPSIKDEPRNEEGSTAGKALKDASSDADGPPLDKEEEEDAPGKQEEDEEEEGGSGGGEGPEDAAEAAAAPPPSPAKSKAEASGAAARGPPRKKRQTTAKGRKKKPSDMPRRPLSAYNYFFREERARWLAESEQRAAHKDEAGGLFSAMGKAIAQRWKNLSEEEGRKYKELAAEDMERYKKEMDEYHTAAARIRRLAEGKAAKAAEAAAEIEASRGDLLADHKGGGLPYSGVGGGMDAYAAASSQDLLRSGGIAAAAGGGYVRGDNADFLRMQQGYAPQAGGYHGMGGMDPSLMAGMGAAGRPMMFPSRLNQSGAGVGGPMWSSFNANPYLDPQPFSQGDSASSFGMSDGGPAGAAALRAQLFNMNPSAFANPLAPSQFDQGRWGMGGGAGQPQQQQFLQAQQQQQQSMFSMGGGVPGGTGSAMSNLYYGQGGSAGGDMGSAGPNPMDSGGPGLMGGPDGGGTGGMVSREDRMMMLQQLLGQQQQPQMHMQGQQIPQGGGRGDRDDAEEGTYV